MKFLLESSNIKIGQEAQKFHSLLVSGISKTFNNGIETLNVIPVTSKSHMKRFWNVKSEIIENVKYSYIPFINLPLLKNIITFFYTFYKIVIWSINNKTEKKIVLCDILRLSGAIGALIGCKLTNTTIIAIVTDVPGLMITDKSKNNLKKRLFNKLGKIFITKYSGYILLTDQMNEIVNTKNKPYIIIEGLVDEKMASKDNNIESKAKERVLIYAGGIYERLGVKKLIEAFMMLSDTNLRLHLYGPGEMQKVMPNYMLLDKRIKYFGVIPNYEIVECELKATLLVNPRPSNEEFTKYSFPSKNMEYMVSGTPIVTTKLPGMPEEYLQYVYLFNDESVEGIFNTLDKLLSKSTAELHEFGINAKSFVLREKSNIVQATKIIKFIKNRFITE